MNDDELLDWCPYCEVLVDEPCDDEWCPVELDSADLIVVEA